MPHIKIDEKGRITRPKKKTWKRKTNKKERDLKRHTKKELRTMSKSDKHYDHGVFKNARVMGKPKDKYISLYEHDLHSERVNYPYDGRCHPAKTSRK